MQAKYKKNFKPWKMLHKPLSSELTEAHPEAADDRAVTEMRQQQGLYKLYGATCN